MREEPTKRAGQPYRLAQGGEIDRSRVLRGRFDGRSIEAFAGDTLASALLASGTRLIARSFKYHRPRGILTAGSEEPKHVSAVLDAFDKQFKLAKEKLAAK